MLEITEMQKRYGHLAPSLANQSSFKIPNIGRMITSTNIHYAYCNFDCAYTFLKTWDLMSPQTRAAIGRDKSYFEQVRNADQYIRSHPHEALNYQGPVSRPNQRRRF